MSRYFSDRHGFGSGDAAIIVREDAPPALRYAIAEIARRAGLAPSSIRSILCGVLFEAPDPSNWSEYPSIWDEVLSLLDTCEWYKVYDIAETIWRSLEHRYDQQELFEAELNRLFREKGIGWELKSPLGIVFRGDANFTNATEKAVVVFQETGRETAAVEIREALKDISRRPVPDRTGAIQHAMAAVECAARDLTGEPNLTLGRLIPRLNVPRPLDSALEKLWGYASENGRHIREGTQHSAAEAELVVSIACAVSVFLIQRETEISSSTGLP
ncbi:AbiJ-NTD4 domain-containing protein [Manganibacter manganicus]|uniref:HEPN AbiJ-N-terminal domain-containing protein n=1 Tax=Manganibacter manganicus TaxID=1873176 RepID=A0A1V8RJR3_9HYPH|nr:hypothetical protein [Pseudaminobacter manganicus]OQM73333.1 hypothetical protein BFN67_08460 [Pseudaminobacter manganicus]